MIEERFSSVSSSSFWSESLCLHGWAFEGIVPPPPPSAKTQSGDKKIDAAFWSPRERRGGGGRNRVKISAIAACVCVCVCAYPGSKPYISWDCTSVRRGEEEEWERIELDFARKLFVLYNAAMMTSKGLGLLLGTPAWNIQRVNSLHIVMTQYTISVWRRVEGTSYTFWIASAV